MSTSFIQMVHVIRLLFHSTAVAWIFFLEGGVGMGLGTNPIPPPPTLDTVLPSN